MKNSDRKSVYLNIKEQLDKLQAPAELIDQIEGLNEQYEEQYVELKRALKMWRKIRFENLIEEIPLKEEILAAQQATHELILDTQKVPIVTDDEVAVMPVEEPIVPPDDNAIVIPGDEPIIMPRKQ